MNKPEHILLQGVVGSTAYGMAVPGMSDVDRGGVYAADPVHLLDLNRDKPEEPTYTAKEPGDMWLHEAKKICRLALNGNPTVSEILWLDKYEIVTGWGQALIDIRKSFLSAHRIRYGYLGFATSQLHRFFGYMKDPDKDEGRKHAAKNARHLWRLLYQGYWAYMGEGIVVKLEPDIAALAKEFGQRAASGEVDLVRQEVARYEKLFDEVRSPLPVYPDNTMARAWLHELRRSMM